MIIDFPPECLQARLDREISPLIAKIVNGEATPDEMVMFRELEARRARLMYPRR